MFCKHCGKAMPDGVKFCPACGKPSGNPGGAQGAAAGNPGVTTGGQSVSMYGQGGANAYQAVTAGIGKPPVKIKKTYNIGNFAYWGGCLLALLGLFLPYCSVSFLGYGESINLIDTDDGKIFLGIIIALAVINIFKLNIVSIAGSILLLSLVVYENDNIKSYAGGLADYEIGHTLLYLGSIVMLIAAIAALVMWIMKKRAAQ